MRYGFPADDTKVTDLTKSICYDNVLTGEQSVLRKGHLFIMCTEASYAHGAMAHACQMLSQGPHHGVRRQGDHLVGSWTSRQAVRDLAP